MVGKGVGPFDAGEIWHPTYSIKSSYAFGKIDTDQLKM
jgi:hypothetical protein